MGRKKRNSNNAQSQEDPNKKPRPSQLETGEKYLVKKYRADKIFPAMEAFVKYTKSHRMLDASYVRWNTTNPDKPHLYSTRVGGQDLAWGQGKTRELAMDAACRAAFGLVQAHGYQFPLDDDCMLEPPPPMHVVPPPPPPPPPPPVMGLPPLPAGLPPPPPGTAAPTMDLIPQAQMTAAPTMASSIGNAATAIHMMPPAPTAIGVGAATVTPPVPSMAASATATAPPPPPAKKTVLKGGLILVYDSPEDLPMEYGRAMLPRYQKMLQRLQQKVGA